MSQTVIKLGFVPKNRGEFNGSARYYKDNIVQYNGSSYIADPEGYDPSSPESAYNVGVAPWTTDPQTLNAGWRVFASGNNKFTTGEAVDEMGVDDVPTAGSDNMVKSGGVQNELALGAVYDVSTKNPTAGPNNDGKWESLSALLSDANLNTLIPTAYRKGGMSIKFVQTSDNKYVQHRLIANEFTTDTTQWAIVDEGVYVENPEFIRVYTDNEGRLLWAIKTDGSIYYGVGVPQQVVNYINEKIAELSLDEYEDIVVFLDDLEKGDETLQDLLNEKVDKENGKSLIDAEFAEGVSQVENSEFAEIHTDAEDKILYGVKKDGDFYFGNGVPSQIDKAKVNRVKGKSLIDEKFALSQSVADNPEYIQAVTDSDNRIIEAITHDGEKVFSGDVTIKGQLNTANFSMKSIENKEWLKVFVDSKGRIIGGIRKDCVYDIKTVLDNTVNNLSINSALYKECIIQQLGLMRKIIPYDIRLANSFGHLYLNPYSNITQVVHPKVLYFDNGFNGYKYWMAVTPYPKGAVKLENPCILRSDDGYKWEGIAANPLSLPDGQHGTYNSDTHLVYKNNTLECWYRYVNVNEADISFEQIKRRTSSNGVDWNAEETMFSTEELVAALSPAIIWDTDHYDIWLVNGYGGYHIEYLQSTDGHNPVKVRDINLEYNYNGVEYYVWHIDVIKDNGTFVLVAMCKEKNNSSSTAKWTLFLSTSDDNVNYTTPKAIIIGSDNWDNQLYRSSIVKVGSEYRLYYSARDYSLNYFTSVSISNSLNNFIGIINL